MTIPTRALGCATPQGKIWPTMDASIYTAQKVDCHCHVLDPSNFAHAEGVHYRPCGQETGTAGYFAQVLDTYGVQYALLVGPNSGYDFDNRCMLAAIQEGQGRFKGIAVVSLDASTQELQDLKAQGIVGAARRVWSEPLHLGF